MTTPRRRDASRLPGRIVMLAFAATLAAVACGSSTTSPGATNDGTPTFGASSPITPNPPSVSATSAPSVAPLATPAAGASSPGNGTSASPTGITGAPGTAPLAWTGCGTPFQCATLRVPLDWAHPQGRQISIAVARLPAADPARRIGSLVTNPGGPGASGIEFLKGNAELLFAQALRDRLDIVSFDPRGTGASTPVTCVDGPGMDRLTALDLTPDTAAEHQALVDVTREFDRACATNSGDLLPFMSTADAARDMDRLREALGDEKLTYLGFSYGTFLGTVYAGLFPTKVRALVLDGAVDPVQPFAERIKAQAMGFERALGAFFDECSARPSCAFFNRGHPAEAFDALMSAIDAKALPAASIHDPRPVGPGEALTGVLYALYSRAAWPVLAQGLAQAQHGDGSLLLVLADGYNERQPDGSYTNVAAANNATACLDFSVPTDVADYDTLAASLARVAPHFGAVAVYSSLTCAFWPVHPAKDPGAIAAPGAPPILVVGTTGDPATPYAWAVNLAKELESGVLLTRTGEGHTAYGESQCITDAVDRYLVSLQLPPPGTTCGS